MLVRVTIKEYMSFLSVLWLVLHTLGLVLLAPVTLIAPGEVEVAAQVALPVVGVGLVPSLYLLLAVVVLLLITRRTHPVPSFGPTPAPWAACTGCSACGSGS